MTAGAGCCGSPLSRFRRSLTGQSPQWRRTVGMMRYFPTEDRLLPSQSDLDYVGRVKKLDRKFLTKDEVRRLAATAKEQGRNGDRSYKSYRFVFQKDHNREEAIAC